MSSIDFLIQELAPIGNKYKIERIAARVYCDYMIKHGTLSDNSINQDAREYIKREEAVYRRVARREIYKHENGITRIIPPRYS